MKDELAIIHADVYTRKVGKYYEVSNSLMGDLGRKIGMRICL